MSVNLGALTTTFTPPSYCTTDIYPYVASNWKCGTSLCDFGRLGPSLDLNCNPSGFTTDPATSFYYSPGVCPSGHTVARSHTANGTASETFSTCCPSSYACQTETGWPWYSTELCTHATPDTSTYTVTFFTSGSQKTSTTAVGGGINAYGIRIRKGPDSASSPASVSATPTSTQTFSATATNTSAGTTEEQTSASLSTGAKVGIGVGVGLAGLLIIILAALLFWTRRRARNSGVAPTQTQTQTQTWGDQRPEFKNELSGAGMARPAEIWAPPPEMASAIHTAELEGNGNVEILK
ncbi:hypothetical protein ASPWEDRAFT_28247 [Aspergillus wentii DTO 134E9]|uniref:Mid2 domain-containing protein n=1 Tax=Aspergillus wentii DTO 134E9 TaxID=1073089 RepID=A0A1L9RL10_ASPWE|nr:uncharacterized protein ASPWEDRAFT_28247 [Aspergillus wentii DTO 134E9]KAI9924607.1 hypothetical protein MW887_006880 [Aspergillus wentii]OJJ35629.1 hypothetical protein ASPWEDRAFT_28247 [Aspergillus wentii DTO 134E9]